MFLTTHVYKNKKWKLHARRNRYQVRLCQEEMRSGERGKERLHFGPSNLEIRWDRKWNCPAQRVTTAHEHLRYESLRVTCWCACWWEYSHWGMAAKWRGNEWGLRDALLPIQTDPDTTWSQSFHWHGHCYHRDQRCLAWLESLQWDKRTKGRRYKWMVWFVWWVIWNGWPDG